MAEHLTPEEKLLKIVENSPLRNKKEGKPKLNVSANNIFSLAKLISFFTQIKLATVNRILVGVCFLATVLLLLDFNSYGSLTNQLLVNAEKEAISISATAAARKVVPRLSAGDVLADELGRNIFNASTMTMGSSAASQPQELKNVLTDVNVVGIIWSQSNPQVMLEDKKNQTTNLFSVGDRVGDMMIKKITMDKVMIEYGNREYELK